MREAFSRDLEFLVLYQKGAIIPSSPALGSLSQSAGQTWASTPSSFLSWLFH